MVAAFRVRWDPDAPVLRAVPTFDDATAKDWQDCAFLEGQLAHPSEKNPYAHNPESAARWDAGRCSPVSP